jgi:hypothetical protein
MHDSSGYTFQYASLNGHKYSVFHEGRRPTFNAEEDGFRDERIDAAAIMGPRRCCHSAPFFGMSLLGGGEGGRMMGCCSLLLRLELPRATWRVSCTYND